MGSSSKHSARTATKVSPAPESHIKLASGGRTSAIKSNLELRNQTIQTLINDI